MTDAIVLYPIHQTYYIINLPDPLSIFQILVGISLWFILVRTWCICSNDGKYKDTFITHQLEEINVDLTVVSYCFIIGSAIALFFIPAGLMAIDSLITQSPPYLSAWDNNNNGEIAANLLTYAGYLLIALIVWFLLNVVQLLGEVVEMGYAYYWKLVRKILVNCG